MAPTRKTTVTKADLLCGLRDLGLREGSVVGVHSSLSSFGYVDGGAEAVIDALLEAVGKTGSVVMPTHSANLEHVAKTPDDEAAGVTWKSRGLPYDPKTTPCTTGRIADTFWRRKEALRGDHPEFSLAGIGPHAEQLIQGWHRLLELDGQICMLGTTLAYCSSMHLAEDAVKLPGYMTERTTFPPEPRRKYPEEEWQVGVGPYPDFELLEGPCQRLGVMKLARVGDAAVRMAKLRELIDLYVGYLRECPEAFYHGCMPE